MTRYIDPGTIADALHADPTLSDGVIAARLGVARLRVQRVRKTLVAAGTLPHVAYRVDANGVARGVPTTARR